MSEQEAHYGNWVPKNFIYGFIIAEISVLIISFFVPILLIQIILWVVAGIILFFGVLMLNAFYQFGKENNKLQHDLHYLLIDKLGWDGQGRILDIGTGSGGVAIKLALRYPRTRILGIDYWGKGWDFSKAQCEGNARAEGVQDRVVFQKASAINLPFEDEEFDGVVSNFVFHEVRGVKDKRELILEALRVLKKDGAFSIQDPFLTKIFYGNIDEFTNKLKELGIQEVYFTRLSDAMQIPRLMRFGLFLGNIGTLYGKK